jgi:hypothetical protein
MRNTRPTQAVPIPVPVEVVRSPKIYTQEEIDLIDDKYKDRETTLQKICEPVDNMATQYKKMLLETAKNSISIEEPPATIKKESIVFDTTLGKWKLIKDE